MLGRDLRPVGLAALLSRCNFYADLLVEEIEMSGQTGNPHERGDTVERVVRLEVLVDNANKQLAAFQELAGSFTRDLRAHSEAQARAVLEAQERNARALLEVQERNSRAVLELQEANRATRIEDQKAFNTAIADTLKKIEVISLTNSDIAKQFIKRDDLLWIRQAVGSILLLLGGGLWTWWLGAHK